MAQRIERTLDGLLDFCGYSPAVEVFRRLCRYYYTLDPRATAFYVHAYRDMWDSDSDQSPEVTDGEYEKPPRKRGKKKGL